MTVHLFVYGTLMRRARHPMAAMLAANADFVGEGRYAGRLYRVAHYPGVVPSITAGDVVFGDVYALRHPSRLLRRLDVYEGSGPLSQKSLCNISAGCRPSPWTTARPWRHSFMSTTARSRD